MAVDPTITELTVGFDCLKSDIVLLCYYFEKYEDVDKLRLRSSNIFQ